VPVSVVVKIKKGDLAVEPTEKEHRTTLLHAINSFKTERKAQGLSPSTLQFYHERLQLFIKFCDEIHIAITEDLTPDAVRRYLLWLGETGHNSGGVHAAFRGLRAFLNWYEQEYEPIGWNNPLHKVKAPRVPLEPLEPVSLEDIKTLMEICPKGDFYGDRDRALFLFLLDTGCRAREMLSLNIEDVDLSDGSITISGKRAKSKKPRSVFLGQKLKKALRVYLKYRDEEGPLWAGKGGARISYSGLRDILRHRATQAGIDEPTAHSFRRAFALGSLRNGVDIFSLQKMMGHADIQVLRRYLAQTDEDIQEAHRRTSPADYGL
jgi:integrase/recombinase XerD